MPVPTSPYYQPALSPSPPTFGAYTYPSPSYSSPPPLNYHSRHARLPQLVEHKLHWALCQASALRHNVAHDPSYLASASPPAPLNPRVLSETAIPLPTVTVIIASRAVSVYPSSSKPGACVSVADVLYAIHRSLRQPIPPQEVSELSPVELQAAQNTYYSRCRGMERIAQREEPLRLVDLLHNRHTFCGLLPTPDSPDIYVLSVS
ncbi:Na-Ca-ex domain-containing protein [Mycena chlorophos]|uniref:Na-Ca-ex domain-containing protein n=1 Tax=Mycena chlorophos TaxID=658473 RepID=A0A8H6TD00_MYCCL|nr:Na-Ca-ex domain-containing protein [Mycena chlorophos]